MSYLTDHPDLMIEALAVLVKRAGGEVFLSRSEGLGPFNLMSRVEPDGLRLRLVETPIAGEA